jgi:hypothetical protein
MENNKQTAVEWLLNQISINGFKQDIEQAKQMEKEQIKDAYLTCHKEYTAYGKHWEMGMDEKETFEQYYEQTYGGKTFIDLVSDEESKVHEVVKKLKGGKK